LLLTSSERQFVDHFLFSMIIAISLDSYNGDEKGHLVQTQRSCSHLWKKYERRQWTLKIIGTINQTREGYTRNHIDVICGQCNKPWHSKEHYH